MKIKKIVTLFFAAFAISFNVANAQVLVVEASGASFVPQKIQNKLVITPDLEAKFQSERLDCAIRNPGNEQFHYLYISKGQQTSQGIAYTVEVFSSFEDVSEKPPRSSQVALSLKDVFLKYWRNEVSMGVSSSALLPAMDLSNIGELKVVSIGEFEAMPEGQILCTFYPLSN